MTNTAAAVKLTPARRRALLVLMDRHDVGRSGRVSNTTDVNEGLVYWQSVSWLRQAGLARGINDRCGGESAAYVRITEAGIDALASAYGDGGWRGELARLRASSRNGG